MIKSDIQFLLGEAETKKKWVTEMDKSERIHFGNKVGFHAGVIMKSSIDNSLEPMVLNLHNAVMKEFENEIVKRLLNGNN